MNFNPGKGRAVATLLDRAAAHGTQGLYKDSLIEWNGTN